jgi:hypothetical protein
MLLYAPQRLIVSLEPAHHQSAFDSLRIDAGPRLATLLGLLLSTPDEVIASPSPKMLAHCQPLVLVTRPSPLPVNLLGRAQ